MTIIEKFKKSILRGTGEAVSLALQFPDKDFSKDIIYACTHRVVYEAQADDDRELYYATLILLSPKRDYILSELQKTLKDGDEDWYVLELIFSIFKELLPFKPSLKETIYKSFTPQFIIENDTCGLETIIEIDGIKGLLYVSDIIGQALEMNSDFWQDDSYIEIFQDENPEIAVWNILQKESCSKKSISKLLSHFKEIRDLRNENNNSRSKAKLTYEEVLRRISSDERMIIRPPEKNDLSNSDIAKLANELRNETSPKIVRKYLSIFSRIKYPDSPDDILKYVNIKKRKYASCYDQALYALELLQSSQVRNFALDHLNNSKEPEQYIDLLRYNYSSEDNDLLNSMAKRFRSLYKIERLASVSIEIAENFDDADLSSVFETLYRKMNCAICRYSILELMVKQNSLPKWISQEIKYDSYKDTRLLFDTNKDSLKEIYLQYL